MKAVPKMTHRKTAGKTLRTLFDTYIQVNRTFEYYTSNKRAFYVVGEQVGKKKRDINAMHVLIIPHLLSGPVLSAHWYP